MDVRTDEETAFMEASIAHQLGDLSTVRLSAAPNARDMAVARASRSALLGRAATRRAQPPVPQPDARILAGTTGGKAARALAGILAAGADFDVLVDMQDRRVRPAAVEGTAFPVFSFNRFANDPGRILWPLPLYHDLESTAFLGGLDPAAVPWTARVPRAVWRGAAGGRAAPRPAREGIRLKTLLRRHAENRLDDGALRARLEHFPRVRLVARHLADPRFDIGFTHGNGFDLARVPALADLARPPLAREEMQRFRYILVLRGLDIGSSFYWTMNSGSLGLVMDTPFHSFASVHFRPWEHYVPFREDLSDLEKRLAWCRDNDAECRDMAARAACQCRLLARADLRAHIEGRVVAGVAAALGVGYG